MTELNQQQIELIRETWTIMESEKEKVGISFFKGMFETFPDYLTFFEHHTLGGSAEALLANEKFAQEHIVGGVMKSIGKLVKNLEKPATIQSVLIALGKSHGKRNIKVHHFENAKVLLTNTFKGHLGSKWTPEVEDAWKAFLNHTFDIIYKGL